MVGCFLTPSTNIQHEVQKAVYQGGEKLQLVQKYAKFILVLLCGLAIYFHTKPKHLGITNIWNLYVAFDCWTIYDVMRQVLLTI